MIDYEVIKKCDFPILKVNGFLSEKDLSLAKDEVIKLSSEAQHAKGHMTREYERVFVDRVYLGNRENSDILQIIQKNLFSEEMKEIYSSIRDTSFKLIPNSSYHETQITFYKNENSYDWHTDEVLSRVINWVLYIDIDSDFTGGENEISNDEHMPDSDTKPYNVDISTKPKDNLLLLMPSWVTHRVVPVFCKHDDKLRGRITINGHIGFAQ